ncbi:MAG: transposase, partial [Pseudomonadota bacterium]
MDQTETEERGVVGGVDMHNDLHVAAVIDTHGRLLASGGFPTTRKGCRLMLERMCSFGFVERVGVEATGTYGAGLLWHLSGAGVSVLEVTASDRRSRRMRGKNDHLDAGAAAQAAQAGQRTVTPKTRDGMIEALRVLRACRKGAVQARRIALQMISNTIVSAPALDLGRLRDTVKSMTRTQLIRTLAGWRPEM